MNSHQHDILNKIDEIKTKITDKEYKDIVPPTIDTQHPERINIFFL